MRAHSLKLDVLRGLAAQPVVLSHTSSMLFAPSAIMTAIGWSATLAVIFFFVLSGYAIGGGLREEINKTGRIDLKDFVIRRVARIYPPYLLTLALVLIYFSTHQPANYDDSLAATFRALAFAFKSSDAITLTPVWSLRIEVGLYAVAGIAFYAFAESGARRLFSFCAAACVTALICWKLSFGFIGLACFAAGAAISFITDKASQSDESSLWKPIVPLGSWSYTLYLIHMPVVLVTTELLSTVSGNSFFLLAAALLIANAVAFLFSRIVERPREIARAIRKIQFVATPYREAK